MKLGQRLLGAVMIAGVASAVPWAPAEADKLDDVIESGKLRCAVVLDFPPIGFRDENNEPVGFDVDYCKDLAKVLDVEPVIVEVTWPERIPALISGRADVAIAGASDTLERAKTVGFTIPYIVYLHQVMARAEANIQTFEDLKGKKVGSVIGTTPEIYFLEYFKEWDDPDGKYISYQAENETYIALAQGKVDAVITTNTAVSNVVRSGKYEGIVVGPVTPFPRDVTSLMANRQEHGWIRFLNLFLNRQARDGRYEELYEKWVGGEAPSLTIPGVYY